MENTVVEGSLEEARGALASPPALTDVVDIKQHSPQRLLSAGDFGGRHFAPIGVAEVRDELAAAEVRPVKALTSRHAAAELVPVLDDVVVRVACILRVQVHVRLDDVGHVSERERVALRVVVIDEVAVAPLRAANDSLALDLRAEDGEAANGPEDVDALDAPLELRLPVDRFEDATSGGGGHNVV